MAAPAYETMSTTGSVGGATVSPSAPSGTAPGDLLIAFATATDNATWTTPTGWTLEEGGTRNAVLSRIATASESSYSFGKSTSGGAVVSIYRFSNAYQNPTLSGIPAIHASATASDATSPTLTGPSVTTTEADCLILRLLENNYTSAAAEDPTIPTDTTEIEAVQYGTSNGIRIGAAYSEQSATGASGTADWTVDAGVGNLFTVAIRPRETPTLSSAATLPTDLSAHWEDSASSSVGSNTLTQSNAANGTLTFGSGAKVGDYHFQTYQTGGESGLYYLKNGTALALQAPFTVAFWTKLNAGSANAKTLLTLTGTDVDDITVTQPGGSGAQTATLQVGGVSLGTDSTALESWAFVALRANGSGQLAMRLNGGSWQSGVHDAGQLYDELRVGQITTDGMNWDIDSISAFDRALSDDEVDILYNAGAGNAYPWRALTAPGLTLSAQGLQAGPLITAPQPAGITVAGHAPLGPVLTTVATAGLTIAAHSPSPGTLITSPQSAGITVAGHAPLGPVLTTVATAGLTITAHSPATGPLITAPQSAGITVAAHALPTPVLTTVTTSGLTIAAHGLAPSPRITAPQSAGLTVAAHGPTPGPLLTAPQPAGLTVAAHSTWPPGFVTTVQSSGLSVAAHSPSPGPMLTTVTGAGLTVAAHSTTPGPMITTVTAAGLTVSAHSPSPGPLLTTVTTAGLTIAAVPPDITPTPIDATGLKLLNLANPGPLTVLPMITQDTGVAIGRVVDQDLEQFPLTGLHMALLTVWDQQSQQLIRGSHDVRNAGTVTIDETEYSGDDITRLTWSIETLDTELIDITVAQGRETHRAVFEFGWNAERITTLVSPFAVTSGSALVTVTAPSHGLDVKDAVGIVGSSAVGGLSLDGVHLVRAKIDDDTFTIEHRPRLSTITTEASATATGGGTPQLLIRPRKATHEIKLQLSAADVT